MISRNWTAEADAALPLPHSLKHLLMLVHTPRMKRFVSIQPCHQITSLVQNHSCLLQDLAPFLGARQTPF